MSAALLARLFALGCELKPELPSQKLMSLLGKSWGPVIRAGAEHGLAGSSSALPTVSVEQLTQLYMSGVETGAVMSLEEFRSTLAGKLYEGICGNDNISALDQLKLAGELSRWYDGRNSTNGDEELGWDAEVATPPFTKSGFWPLDRIMGVNGVPQEVITLLARPEAGKTTVCLALAHQWKRSKIGSVVMIQTEIAASAIAMKIRGMARHGEALWTAEDSIVYGRRGAQTKLDWLINNPDPNRLVIFDSIGGMAGQGDSPDSRNRFANLYDELVQVKNGSRMVLAAGHVKRGVDMVDIESAAGSSAIERFSGGLVYMTKDPTPKPNGHLDAKFEIVKNRYAGHVRPIKFDMNYVTGEVFEQDEVDELMETLQ